MAKARHRAGFLPGRQPLTVCLPAGGYEANSLLWAHMFEFLVKSHDPEQLDPDTLAHSQNAHPTLLPRNIHVCHFWLSWKAVTHLRGF